MVQDNVSFGAFLKVPHLNHVVNPGHATTTPPSTTTIILPTGHPVFSRQGAPFWEGFFPHFVGGTHRLKSFLFSPCPAIPPYVVGTPHPGITDDREHTTSSAITNSRKHWKSNVKWCFGFYLHAHKGFQFKMIYSQRQRLIEFLRWYGDFGLFPGDLNNKCRTHTYWTPYRIVAVAGPIRYNIGTSAVAVAAAAKFIKVYKVYEKL